MTPSHLTRRSFIVGGTTGLCLARLTDMAAAAATPLNMQLGWLGGGNQLGEVCALRLGYFEKEGLDFKIQPGGPNNDGIAVVASGRYEVGQVSSSPLPDAGGLAGSADQMLCRVGAKAPLRLLLTAEKPGA